MKKQTLVFNIFSGLTVLLCAGILIYFLMDQSDLSLFEAITTLLGTYIVFSAFMLTGIFGIPAILTFLTMSRARRYAKKLRQAGYDVHIDKEEVRQLSIQIILVLLCAVMVALLTPVLFRNMLAFMDGSLSIATLGSDTFYFMLMGNVMFGVLYITCIAMFFFMGFECFKIWRDSFKPIKSYYQQLQRGEPLDLPRLLSINSTF